MYTIHNTYSYQDGFTTIEDAIDHLVATTPEQDHFITNDLGNTTVAIYHQSTVFLPRAAAADLLAACEAMLNGLSPDTHHNTDPAAIKLLCNAIAAAKGEMNR